MEDRLNWNQTPRSCRMPLSLRGGSPQLEPNPTILSGAIEPLSRAVGGPHIVSASAGSLSASWSAPTGGAEGYHVTYTCDAKQSWHLAALDQAATIITVSDVAITRRTASIMHRRGVYPQKHPLRVLDR